MRSRYIFQHQRKGNNNDSKRHLMYHPKFPRCCRASVLWIGKKALDVASDDPPDEALSCHRRVWDVPKNFVFADNLCDFSGFLWEALHFQFLEVESRAAKRGCFKRGGFPIWTCPFFLVFFVLLGFSRFFWDFPICSGGGPGIFPICPFPLSGPINSTYEEQSRKGPRHNLDLSRKRWEHPGLETPRLSFSQLKKRSML